MTSRVSRPRLERIAASLDERSWRVVRILAEHRFATTNQLAPTSLTTRPPPRPCGKPPASYATSKRCHSYITSSGASVVNAPDPPVSSGT